MSHGFLAIDLGAESGRTILGTLRQDRLVLSECYRFRNQALRTQEGLKWDVKKLWLDIQHGITDTVKAGGITPASIGINSWGVDFGLLDQEGRLITDPFHYRDSRTQGMVEKALQYVSQEDIFSATGNQILQINTLYQLLAMVEAGSSILDRAETLVMIPDLFNYWLSGELVNEFTIATTSQCLNPCTHDWAWNLLESLNIPTRIFKRNHAVPGNILGRVLPKLANEVTPSSIDVVLPACHDTGSAVVAIPASKADIAWISSGTWSILGVELPEPYVTPSVQEANFTNEGGVFDTWRLSKNIMGLWLLQECRRTWQKQGEDLSYKTLTGMAREAPHFLAVIDPDDEIFLQPGDMPARIRDWCARSGQTVPDSKGEVVRTVLESLAFKYRWTLDLLEKMIGRTLDPVHIVGGGSQNQLLNQLTADATGRLVIAGPVEATAIGNVLMQAIALGELESLEEARSIVRTSFNLDVYEPTLSSACESAYHRMVRFVRESPRF